MADSSIRSNTKTFIRSTLLSQKGTVTATQLNRDYRELVGDYIPYHKLQFRDLESFLAAIPDVCHVDWDGGQMVVTGVAGKASGHIKEMVSKQKTKSGGGKRFRGYWNGEREREVRPGFRYNSYNFDLSDVSDWENDYMSNVTVEKAKLTTVDAKAMPAGYEDSCEDEDFSTYSMSDIAVRNKPNASCCVLDEKYDTKVDEDSHEMCEVSSKAVSLPSLLKFCSGPLPPCPLSSPSTYNDLIVCLAITPHQFSVQSLDTRHLYQSLSDQMTEYYSVNSHSVSVEDLSQGSIVATQYKGRWYRSEVTKSFKSHFLVCLRLVDTGKMILCTSSQDIQPLLAMFSELPVQAVSARLAGVRPGNGKCWWQVETDWFSEAVLEKPCVGVVKEVVEAVLVMELYNSSEEEDLEVGKKMIKLGLAKEEWKRSLF